MTYCTFSSVQSFIHLEYVDKTSMINTLHPIHKEVKGQLQQMSSVLQMDNTARWMSAEPEK